MAEVRFTTTSYPDTPDIGFHNSGEERQGPIKVTIDDDVKKNSIFNKNTSGGKHANWSVDAINNPYTTSAFDFSSQEYKNNKSKEKYQKAVVTFAQSQLETMDTDGDGTVSEQELALYNRKIAERAKDEAMRDTLLRLNDECSAKDFKALDYNGDGKLDLNEIKAKVLYEDYDTQKDQYDCKLDTNSLEKFGTLTEAFKTQRNLSEEEALKKAAKMYNICYKEIYGTNIDGKKDKE